MDFKCTCLNSGTNSFTGHCDRCGMSKPSNGTIVVFDTTLPPQTVQEFIKEHASKQTVEEVVNNVKLGLKFSIEDLPRYNNYSLHDNPCMVKNKDGKYIKLEDVLSLFSSEKE